MKQIKLGHQAPKEYINKNFHTINIPKNKNNGIDYSYDSYNNFIYNNKLEEEKLYNAQPCYYTDKRYYDPDAFDVHGDCYLRFNREESITLKSCIRMINNCRNIPKGTIINIGKAYYHPGKRVDNSYLYKTVCENNFDPDYKIDNDYYFNNFKNCERSQGLVELLRSNGFIVIVQDSNPSTLIGEEKGEIAIAYGYNKRIGFSSSNNCFRGYANGKDNILFDEFGYFNKWSQCVEISKSLTNEEIVKKLMVKGR